MMSIASTSGGKKRNPFYFVCTDHIRYALLDMFFNQYLLGADSPNASVISGHCWPLSAHLNFAATRTT